MTRIEDYALIGDLHTAALVGRDGSIDWLCLPRFDSPACFAALLGSEENGRWRLSPAGRAKTVRRYVKGTLVLETEFETESGAVLITDCMLVESETAALVRLATGLRGTVAMESSLRMRFDYGSIVPWVQYAKGEAVAIAGPHVLRLRASVGVSGDNAETASRFDLAAGQRESFVLSWHPSHASRCAGVKDPFAAVRETERWWRRWSAKSTYDGLWPEAVERSLITLKALTHAPSAHAA